MPTPKDLTAQEQQEYLSLLSQQAAPYKEKADQIQFKIDELWKNEAAMDQVITDFMANDIDPARLDSIRTQLHASEIYALDDTQGLARRYGAALSTGLNVEDVQAWPDILQAVTAEDIMAAAKKVIIPETSVTGWLMKEKEQDQ